MPRNTHAIFKKQFSFLSTTTYKSEITAWGKRKVTIAAILQVGPNNVFLREAENTKSSSTHGSIYGYTRICYQFRTFIKSGPLKKSRTNKTVKNLV